MDGDRAIADAAEICECVNSISSGGGSCTVWLRCGTLIKDVEIAAMDGDFATFGYAMVPHQYKIRADHVVGVSYDQIG
jgi:hypothetical protein